MQAGQQVEETVGRQTRAPVSVAQKPGITSMAAPALPACNLPWIDTVVNSFAGNGKYHNSVFFRRCCPAPGTCGLFPTTGGCTGDVLECTVGNSRFTCRHSEKFKSTTACYHEGTLAATRNIACCPPALPGFLATQTCMSGFASGPKNWVCCKDANDAGSCAWGTTCAGNQAYYGMGGKDSALYYGTTPSEDVLKGPNYCIHEVALGKEVEAGGCLAMTPPPSGCALGGSGPAAPGPTTKSRPTGALPTGTTPSGASTLGRANKMMVYLMAPLLLQLLMR